MWPVGVSTGLDGRKRGSASGHRVIAGTGKWRGVRWQEYRAGAGLQRPWLRAAFLFSDLARGDDGGADRVVDTRGGEWDCVHRLGEPDRRPVPGQAVRVPVENAPSGR